MIVFAGIMPHAPASVPGIGSQEEMEKIEKTIKAINELREGLEQSNPDTIVIISPHARMEDYSFLINSANPLIGNFSQFGLDEQLSFKNDLQIADKIDYLCEMDEFPAKLEPSFLDHGTLVPLFHLTKNLNVKIVQLAFSLMNYERHYRYGEIVGSVIDNIKTKRVAIIASGDLSHRLTQDAPAGFSPEAKNFDRDIIHLLGTNDIASLEGLHGTDVAEAAECGLRSIMILLGSIHGLDRNFHLLSYEGPFGVGYLVARLI
jgi:aromatic ring-opening dioxygenase LigB subunit